jgi:hypothetical protein
LLRFCIITKLLIVIQTGMPKSAIILKCCSNRPMESL